MRSVTPAKDYLFCKIPKAETQTSSGLYLPESAQERVRTAIVVTGEGYDEGSEIIYKPYSTTDFELDGEHYMLVHIDDVMGVLDD